MDRKVLRTDALFSDGTGDYRIPPEPKAGARVAIRFRTAEDNADEVCLYARGTGGETPYPMRKTGTERGFDYYETDAALGSEPFFYYFMVRLGAERVYYDRYGVRDAGNGEKADVPFCILPGYSTPDWSKGAVMYQILVDRFCNGDPSNDVLTREYYYEGAPSRKMKWDEYPSAVSIGEFYGGDLAGVREKLDYLQELGVEVLYFNPLFVSPSNHKYDIQDYDYIDPHFGKIVCDEGGILAKDVTDNAKATCYVNRVTSKENLEAGNRLFADLVKEIHARGMKVILDGVFNHCGSFNKWMDREKIYRAGGGYADGAFLAADSPYRDFFKFKDENAWPDNATYEGWWDYATLPKLNYEASEELYDYIMRIAAKWVSEPYCADGWRLDVAADLGHSPEMNHKFWRDFRRAVKTANPQAIILAEHYGDPAEWLCDGDQWDTVMNYDAFMEPFTWFLTGMEKHSDEYRPEKKGNGADFERDMRRFMASFRTPQLLCAMNELSNHDHSRFLTRTSGTVGRAASLGAEAAEKNVNYGVFREAVVAQMTWQGAPTVYYGDEAGVCGFTDPDNRRTYPWGHENRELIAFHRDMIRIHKENAAFRTGSLKLLECGENVLCYGRFNRKQQFVVILHNGDRETTVTRDIQSIGIPADCVMRRLIGTTESGYSTETAEYAVADGKLTVVMPAHSAVVLGYGE